MCRMYEIIIVLFFTIFFFVLRELSFTTCVCLYILMVIHFLYGLACFSNQPRGDGVHSHGSYYCDLVIYT